MKASMAVLERCILSPLHPHHALTLSCGALGPEAPTSRDEAIHFGASRLSVSCPRRRRMAADPESRVAALENEKRRLLESWQREREKCASQQGTWTKDLCIR